MNRRPPDAPARSRSRRTRSARRGRPPRGRRPAPARPACARPGHPGELPTRVDAARVRVALPRRRARAGGRRARSPSCSSSNATRSTYELRGGGEARRLRDARAPVVRPRWPRAGLRAALRDRARRDERRRHARRTASSRRCSRRSAARSRRTPSARAPSAGLEAACRTAAHDAARESRRRAALGNTLLAARRHRGPDAARGRHPARPGDRRARRRTHACSRRSSPSSARTRPDVQRLIDAGTNGQKVLEWLADALAGLADEPAHAHDSGRPRSPSRRGAWLHGARCSTRAQQVAA